MLLSQSRLRQLLGVLWLIDGVLQLQPQMFTMNMVNGVMVPAAQGQPAPIAASLNMIIAITTQYLVQVNWVIALVQIALGVLFLWGRWLKQTIIASAIWAVIVWYGGEGMSLLLTGHASALTGAPGAVLLYPLLGLVLYPRATPRIAPASSRGPVEAGVGGVLSRLQLRWVIAGFWVFVALLQLQPSWWQAGQISQTIASQEGQGGFNGALVDPILKALASLTANSEVLTNIILIVIFLALGIGLALTNERQLRYWLIASIVVSAILWWGAEGFGMILTGMATDFNSGLLLIVIALAVWPKLSAVRAAQGQPVPATTETKQPGEAVQSA